MIGLSQFHRSGGSLGAALAFWHIEQGNKREVNLDDDMNGSYLGSEFSQELDTDSDNLKDWIRIWITSRIGYRSGYPQ